MTRRVGLELTGDRVRAVTVSAWRNAPVESFELIWNPRIPADAVAVLRQHLGRVSGVALSVGIEFLHVKHVRLPPVSTTERRAILMLEPDRFFPIEGGQVVVSVTEKSDVVFAADAPTIESWVAAFEQWAPVETVEAAPASLVRALQRGGVSDGTFSLPTATEEYSSVELRQGVLVAARRVGAGPVGTDQKDPPGIRGVKPAFIPAFGAALGASTSPDEMLVSNLLLATMKRRRRAGVSRAALNVVLALAFALAAFDRSRARLLERVDAEIAAAAPIAASGVTLQTRLASLDLETAAARNVAATRVSAVAVLAALSRRLPPDATVMSVRTDGDEWQIEGTARDAAALVPALSADPHFADVRFLAASSRFREGSKTYETFSIAFRALR